MPQYLPQSHPLWCAEVYDPDTGEDVTVSRVVAWKETDEPEDDLVPVLARAHGQVSAADIAGEDGAALVFADTAEQAVTDGYALRDEWVANRAKHPGVREADAEGQDHCPACAAARMERREWTRRIAEFLRATDGEALRHYIADALDGHPAPATNDEMVLRVIGNIADRLTMSTMDDLPGATERKGGS